MEAIWEPNHAARARIMMRIIKDQSAGLVIDIQEKLYPHIYEHEALARNTMILINGLKILNVPVLLTQQYTKGLGETIQTIRDGLGKFEVIEKTAFSCCDEPGFMLQLSQLGKRYVILAGIEAHVCVLQTVMDLIENSYLPVVVEDCISSRKINDKHIAVERMRKEGAFITTYESILFELCRYSATEQFKQISKLVK